MTKKVQTQEMVTKQRVEKVKKQEVQKTMRIFGYVATSMNDETVIAEKFPETFKKQLKKFLFEKMREVAPLMKSYIQDQFTSTSKL